VNLLTNFFTTAKPYLELLAGFSIFTFFASLIIIPWYIGRLPQNYFQQLTHTPLTKDYDIAMAAALVFRNIAGAILLISGVLMLFLPGQGILTILIGLLCMSFPGKRKLIMYLISLKSLQCSLNWTRRKLSKAPFVY